METLLKRLADQNQKILSRLDNLEKKNKRLNEVIPEKDEAKKKKKEIFEDFSRLSSFHFVCTSKVLFYFQ